MSNITFDSANYAVDVMDQTPAENIQAQSPLFHVGLDELAKHNSSSNGVLFGERKLLGLLTLRANAQDQDVLNAIESVLGVALPLKPLSSAKSEQATILWISPDEWNIVLPRARVFEVECALREKTASHISLVNASSGSTLLSLSGQDVLTVLQKSCPIDFHLSEFPVGKVVSTVFAKSGAIIYRTGENAFELIVRRSFADYIWLWIQDASREFGLGLDS